MNSILNASFGWVFLQQGGQEGGGYSMLILLGGMIVIFYFFMIRPQMQRQKKEKQFRESLKKGDQVVTIGGMYGKIHKLYDNQIQLEIAQDTIVKVERASVRGYAKAEKAEAQNNKNKRQEEDEARERAGQSAEEQTA